MRGYPRTVDQRRLHVSYNPPRPTWVGEVWYRKVLRKEAREQAAAFKSSNQRKVNHKASKSKSKTPSTSKPKSKAKTKAKATFNAKANPEEVRPVQGKGKARGMRSFSLHQLVQASFKHFIGPDETRFDSSNSSRLQRFFNSFCYSDGFLFTESPTHYLNADGNT